MRTEAPDYQQMEFYSLRRDEDQQLADWLAGRADFGDGADGEVVALR